MEQLKSMKSNLMACAQAQMANLQTVDAKELGEVIDMIKDLEEAIYYCTIVEAMKGENQESARYYSEPHYRDMDRDMGRMYYQGGSNGSSNGSMRNYQESYPMMVRDYREGRSYMNRKNYMEGKEMKKDKNMQMKELEMYMQELSRDITEMIEGASPEERQLLQQKLVFLSNKIK